MSSLWTPGGEHEVPRDPANEADDIGAAEGEHPPDHSLDEAISALLPEGVSLDSLTEEQRQRAEEMVREMSEAQNRLLSTDAANIVANHAMGLYELAAIHLSQQPPDLSQASVAIDGLGALVDALTGRLGEAEPTLKDALSQIRMAFVQIKSQIEEDLKQAASGDPAAVADDSSDSDTPNASDGAGNSGGSSNPADAGDAGYSGDSGD